MNKKTLDCLVAGFNMHMKKYSGLHGSMPQNLSNIPIYKIHNTKAHKLMNVEHEKNLLQQRFQCQAVWHC